MIKVTDFVHPYKKKKVIDFVYPCKRKRSIDFVHLIYLWDVVGNLGWGQTY